MNSRTIVFEVDSKLKLSCQNVTGKNGNIIEFTNCANNKHINQTLSARMCDCGEEITLFKLPVLKRLDKSSMWEFIMRVNDDFTLWEHNGRCTSWAQIELISRYNVVICWLSNINYSWNSREEINVIVKIYARYSR